MQNDNLQTDTPQDSANEQFQGIEEAVFGDTGNEGSTSVSDIFNVKAEEPAEKAPEQGQPLDTQAVENPDTEVEATDNDAKRYAYWQSQADKYKNELAEMKKTQEVPAQTQQPVQETANTPVEEFPPAPERPKRPRSFSREEAYTDPNSESARYLDAKEDWDEQMVEYNTLHTQYQNAVLQEKFDKMENQRVEEAKRQQSAQAAAKQQAEVLNYVTGHHGMNDNEAKDFMTKMSDPSSITIDNLVQLYRMQQGGAIPQQNAAPAQPSETFQQAKNAQQVPSPMGVMPSGQSNVDGRSLEDKMMDSMIGNFNDKNPWK